MPVPRRCRRLRGGSILLALALLPCSASLADSLSRYYRAYPAEALEPVVGSRTPAVRLLPPGGPAAWDPSVRERLEERALEEWPPDRTYGPFATSVGLWLVHPLVTGRDGIRLLVPVTSSARVPLAGVVEIPSRPGLRRVVLLLDASSSANSPTLLRAGSRGVEGVSVLDAERSGLRHFLELSGEAEGLEIGILIYGESTLPLAVPGTPHSRIRALLDAWTEAHPRGTGRTDVVCALETARDWLRDAPAGRTLEIALLTDGDLPHSGRFTACRQRAPAARSDCERRRNRTPCPASHRFLSRDGLSDVVQLERFARRARGEIEVNTLVFDPLRPARHYRELARATGGALFRVSSAEALDGWVAALLGRRIRGVYAENERTEERTGDLLDADTGRFEGSLGLAPGANDILLTVEGSTGPAALHRFRIYSESHHP